MTTLLSLLSLLSPFTVKEFTNNKEYTYYKNQEEHVDRIIIILTLLINPTLITTIFLSNHIFYMIHIVAITTLLVITLLIIKKYIARQINADVYSKHQQIQKEIKNKCHEKNSRIFETPNNVKAAPD
jgi:Ca2+/Na+ antiporter